MARKSKSRKTGMKKTAKKMKKTAKRMAKKASKKTKKKASKKIAKKAKRKTVVSVKSGKASAILNMQGAKPTGGTVSYGETEETAPKS
jgi:hypothetical protein